MWPAICLPKIKRAKPLPAQSVTIGIQNQKGLHARAASKFVKVVSQFQAQVTVCKLKGPEDEGDVCVNGTSILGLMMLGAAIGSTLKISAEGEQVSEVLAALAELINGKFGEE